MVFVHSVPLGSDSCVVFMKVGLQLFARSTLPHQETKEDFGAKPMVIRLSKVMLVDAVENEEVIVRPPNRVAADVETWVRKAVDTIVTRVKLANQHGDWGRTNWT
jgi:hypothetical protein